MVYGSKMSEKGKSMKNLKRMFGGIDLTWKKLIIFAVIAGVYTAVMAILPFTENTSFEDITISFEVWILFGILIITNSRSPKDSAMKCFVFFLISQPIVYLLQVPFSWQGWGLFQYYPFWFIWTLLTIPMGYVGYYIKKDKWWGIVILTPILLFLGLHYSRFLKETISFFPKHLLSAIFCLVTIFIYPVFLFQNKKNRIICAAISFLTVLIMTMVVIIDGKATYSTIIIASGGSEELEFDDTYTVYLEDERYGNVYIEYDEGLEGYVVKADFTKIGETEFIIESPDREKLVYEITIERDSYSLKRKN